MSASRARNWRALLLQGWAPSRSRWPPASPGQTLCRRPVPPLLLAGRPRCCPLRPRRASATLAPRAHCLPCSTGAARPDPALDLGLFAEPKFDLASAGQVAPGDGAALPPATAPSQEPATQDNPPPVVYDPTAGPSLSPMQSALQTAMERLVAHNDRRNPLGSGDWRAARGAIAAFYAARDLRADMGQRGRLDPSGASSPVATRARPRRRPRPVGLGAAAGAWRRARPGRARRSRNEDRLGGRDLCRTGDRIARPAVARLAAHLLGAERRRSGRSARRDGRGGGPRSATRRLQPAAEGLPGAARRIEAPQRGRADRRPTSLARARPHSHRLRFRNRRRVRLWPARAPAGGDPRQHGNVALGAARDGRTADRGQYRRLLGRRPGGRQGHSQVARHRRQAGDADADLLQPHALRAHQSLLAGPRFDRQEGAGAKAWLPEPARLRGEDASAGD